MRTKPLYCLHYSRLSFKMLCKNGNSISVIQWVWDYPQNIKTERFGSQPERSVFPVWVLTGFACCTARKSRSTHAVFCKCSYTCCACSSSNNRIDSNVCSCYNWTTRLKSLGTQLIFIGKWRHRRLDYRLAQANEPVKDAQRGEADSLTGTDGCATRRTACNSPVNPGTLPSGIPEIVVIY